MVPGMGAAIGGAIGGLTSIASGIIGSRGRKAEERKAKAEFAASKQRMAGFDTSNLYANQENAYEDLTVNTQAADFQAQQNQATQANIMSNMAGAAGGSGIAALAQSMANQGAQQAQQASASIGQQEAANERARATQAARLQQLEGAGELQVQQLRSFGESQARSLEYQKTGTMFGMSQQRYAGANEAIRMAKEQQLGAVGDIASLGVDAMTAFGGGPRKKRTDSGKAYQEYQESTDGYGMDYNKFMESDIWKNWDKR